MEKLVSINVDNLVMLCEQLEDGVKGGRVERCFAMSLISNLIDENDFCTLGSQVVDSCIAKIENM